MPGNESELVRDLAAPLKSFRLMAIERVLAEGASPAIIEAIRVRLGVEEDDECRLLLGHALSRFGPETPESEAGSVPLDLEEFRLGFGALPPAEKLMWLERLRKRGGEVVAPFSAELFSAESHPTVRSFLIRGFGRTWQTERLRSLIPLLASEQLAVNLASLEILTERLPQELARGLPPVLGASDPRVRALAIKALARIDPAEALNHLEFLLLSGGGPEVAAGLQIAFHMPFELVKKVILKFLAIEKDPAVVERAGLLLVVNPDPEIPLRLWELVETSSSGEHLTPELEEGEVPNSFAIQAKKGHAAIHGRQVPVATSAPEKEVVLKELIQKTCRVLEASGVLGEKSGEYFQRLQAWITRRKADRFVQQSLLGLSQGEGQEIVEMLNLLGGRLDRPEVREALSRALEWPLTEDLREHVRRLLDLGNVPPRPPALPRMESLSHEEQITTMASWDESQKGDAEAFLSVLMNGKEFPPELKAAGFRAAARLGIPGFSAPAKEALASTKTGLVSAALDYLGKTDFDSVLPLLGKFLKHPEPRVRSNALGLLRREDPQQAIGSLIAMLREPGNHLSVCNCLTQFDFPLIREPLCQLLVERKPAELLRPVLCLFEANPDPDNLYALFRLEKLLPPLGVEPVQETRLRCEQVLIQFGRMTSKEVEDHLGTMENRWREELRTIAGPTPPYALAAIRKARGDFHPGPPISPQGLIPEVLGNGWGIIVIILVLVVGNLILFVGNPSQQGATFARPVVSRTILVRGEVLAVDEKTDELSLRTDIGTVFVISPRDVSEAERRIGAKLALKLRVQMVVRGREIHAQVVKNP